MIVYDNTIEKFAEQCKLNKISSIIQHGIHLKGLSVSSNEVNSWAKSLPIMANVLNCVSIDKKIKIAIEYVLQITMNRIDVLIYGENLEGKESVVIIELKQWSQSIAPSRKSNYINTYGFGKESSDYFHPSYQAYRYKSILESFNVYVQEHDVIVHSCSYLHNMDCELGKLLVDSKRFPYVRKSPVFFSNDIEKLRNYIKKHISKPSPCLLKSIDDSEIKPSNDFSTIMYNSLKGNPIFSLDDSQALAVDTIVAEAKRALENNERATIIVKGGPGSGKSIVALNAMGQLICPENGKNVYNAVYTTKNFTPLTVFTELFLKQQKQQSPEINIKALFRKFPTFIDATEFCYDCVLLDEAHRAYQWHRKENKKDVEMIDKLFNAARVNVFFIDEDQIVTKDDYLTIETIKEYAKKYHSEVIEDEELHLSNQFRCMGGDNYISFINTLLGYDNKDPKYCKDNKYEFKVFDTPSQLWEAIKEKQKQYPLSRLLAGYTHKWESENDDTKYDFIFNNDNFKMKWNKKVPWSYINDPEQADRIGCIHTIQGVDMHYAGVIIGEDMIYRDEKIQYDQTKNASSDYASGIKNAETQLANKLIRNTYKVLLTRAIYGTYIYCEDECLNRYIKSLLEPTL